MPQSTSLGKIDISDEVIEQIVGAAASDIYGVKNMASKGAMDTITGLVRRDNPARGVKVTRKEEGLLINIHITVDYGVNMIAVGNNIIERVKYTVEKMTGETVDKVIVNIDGIRV
ncbi:Asp23/Gls24 family envelope stress response protein [Calorimonas adulescens]|uniref:Asp23/Gls24 family envelope stress response protein n=1 Tax=Calorimonas adulescens TaxID=2606906 RepID=UPI001396A851|nr:Asp23/Gls24 family envelope stress response protein [Calorimonas adulescens]